MSDTTEARTVIKKIENCIVYSDGTFRLMNVRASYAHVAKAQESTADDGKKSLSYSIVGLMDKKTHRAAKDHCIAVINEMLKDAKIKAIPADKKFIKDGDQAAKDGYEGMWTVAAREKTRPALRHRRKDPKTGKPARIDPEKEPDVIYSGCYVNILVRPWFQNNDYGKRVNLNLLGVQFWADGEPFGTGRISEDDIDDSFEGDDDGSDTGGFDDDTDGL